MPDLRDQYGRHPFGSMCDATGCQAMRGDTSVHIEIPRIVVLCGSTRFQDAFLSAQRDKTLSGEIVLSVGLFGHSEGLDMSGPVKAGLDDLHKRKIDLADYVLVLNVDGYIGSSTRSEIEYATAIGRPVQYLEPVV